MPPLPQTQKEYEQNAFLTSLTTTLCGVSIGKDGAARIALAATLFFAEGGGQPADRGSVTFALAQGQATATVLDVHEAEGIIWHTLDALPTGASEAIGCTVTCTLDWAHRLDSMQQHTGEHILSGILHQLYGAENVGFHIGSSFVRMDTSCPLTAAQLQLAEEKANEMIWQNVPIETLLPSRAELAAMTYRSKKEIDGQVRIVQIAGTDTCACCGTHLHSSGQVGQIKILASEHYKGGERLSVACGKRALTAAQGMRAREAEIGALLSAKPELTAAAVQRVYAELGALKFAKQGIEQQLFAALAAQAKAAAQIPPVCGNHATTHASDSNNGNHGTAGSNRCTPCPAIFTVNGLTPDGLHKLAETLRQETTGLCAALCETKAETGVVSTGYCIAHHSADLRPLCKALNAALHGRGGGKPNICQGSAMASAAEITAFLQSAAQELR